MQAQGTFHAKWRPSHLISDLWREIAVSTDDAFGLDVVELCKAEVAEEGDRKVIVRMPLIWLIQQNVLQLNVAVGGVEILMDVANRENELLEEPARQVFRHCPEVRQSVFQLKF